MPIRLALLFTFALAALAVPPQTHPCLPCHPREVARFDQTAMGQSLGAPSHEPGGSFSQRTSGANVQIFWKDGKLHHQIRQAGLQAEYPVSYSIGHGNVGKSYLVQIGGQLFQSPAAYYTGQAAWAPSPGYETDKILDFWRPIDSNCLFCHSGSNRISLVPISCDRCHGASERHLQRPVPGTIVNPAKLAGRERDSICEQCHLEGATAVLNPGKYWWDFKAGEALEKVQATYVYRGTDESHAPVAAVSHAEQLALSRCRRESGGKFWCGTCHNPHGEAADRNAEMKQICQTCHPTGQLASTHKADQNDCVACHMPKRNATDVLHAAITDHRILRVQDSPVPAKLNTEPVLTAWVEPEPGLSRRNKGLALFYTAKQGHSKNFPLAYDLLSTVATEADPAAEAAKGYMLLGSGHTQQAVACFQSAVRSEPDNAEYWLDLGVAQEAAGDTAAAEQALRKSTIFRKMDYRPYKALAELYSRNGDTKKSRDAISEFLSLVPQSIVMRLEP